MIIFQLRMWRRFARRHKKGVLLTCISGVFVLFGCIALWISTFTMPDLQSFETRKVTQATKIYDRTGQVALYDVFKDSKRTTVPFDQISRHIKNATVAIEDAEFYEHHGVKPTAFLRAIIANLLSGSFSQGGSTITQQVIKNALLTKDKSLFGGPERKMKEWVLALELEKEMTKDAILNVYLNENPYGGTLYGVQEASKAFFGKNAADVTLTEAAYIAALPQAPTFYSPYGQNKARLDERAKLVLAKMLENKFITEDEYAQALTEEVVFLPRDTYGIRAPHFVEFVRAYLVNKYGERAIAERGFKVITTLDWGLQEQSEKLVKEYALSNQQNFNAENAAAVAIDPKTGQILMMVGSYDYFSTTTDGNFNVALAHRQPGSTFKPFVYATAFAKGYTPDTVVFDAQTEFQTTCTPDGKPRGGTNPDDCYMPENYDSVYVGPISLRNALAQSRNIPAIKALYLSGIADSIRTARSLGITSLTTPEQYGLTLVLGGGEVSLLEITNAYASFANEGVRNPYTAILRIEDSQGNIVEEYAPRPQQTIEKNVALLISDVLADKVAKIPAYGTNSPLYFGDRPVASKTGTTNDYRDAWTIGYTPEIALGAWAGNNDNSPMEKRVAGMIIAPLWHELMARALASTTGEIFEKPLPTNPELKPVLRGLWQGNETYIVDRMSGKLATELTPLETQMEVSIPNPHTILYWVDKRDPLGDAPAFPQNDPQFDLWEYGVQKWLAEHPQSYPIKPTEFDSLHTEANRPKVTLLAPTKEAVYNRDSRIQVAVQVNGVFPITRAYFYLNNELLGTSESAPFSFSFIPSSSNTFSLSRNEFRVVVEDAVYNKREVSIPIVIH